MNANGPVPALYVFERESHVLQPCLIEEIEVAVGQTCVNQRRNRIDEKLNHFGDRVSHLPKPFFAVLKHRLSARPFDFDAGIPLCYLASCSAMAAWFVEAAARDTHHRGCCKTRRYDVEGQALSQPVESGSSSLPEPCREN